MMVKAKPYGHTQMQNIAEFWGIKALEAKLGKAVIHNTKNRHPDHPEPAHTDWVGKTDAAAASAWGVLHPWTFYWKVPSEKGKRLPTNRKPSRKRKELDVM